MPDPADAKEYAAPRVRAASLDWPTYERMIQQESRWEHWSSPGVVKTSYSGVAKGLGQLHKSYYPEDVWSDPYRNLDASIETLRKNLARFGSYRKGLAAYNWGGGNVGGYTDSAGRVHPAWDGTREWRCPHEAVVAQCRTAQRDHYLDVILGPGWPEPGEAAPAPTNGIVYEEYPIPFVGAFSHRPKGIILHGSRSGVAGNSLDKEYLGTARYAVSNPGGLGWNATIGERKVAVHLEPGMWSWNARAASGEYLAVEIAQPTAAHTVTDAQVAALADWIKTRALPVWPQLPMHFPTHAEVERNGETGQRDGKTDVYPFGDARADELRARIMAALGRGGAVEQPAGHSYVLGFADLAGRLGRDVVGDPLEDEHDAERGGHPIRHQLTTTGELVYWVGANRAEFYRAAA